MSRMRVALVEPYYSGSHRYWVDRLKAHLQADVDVFTCPGRHWKWRMAAAAIPLAEEVNKTGQRYDVILATDMLDLTNFKALLNHVHRDTPIVLYMHENQVVYPFQTHQKDKNRDRHYGLINYKSMLVADEVWFNSAFHQTSLLNGLEEFLMPFPESKYYRTKLSTIEAKSVVMPLGVDVEEIKLYQSPKPQNHVVLWNHRWEHDKNPETFFTVLEQLSEEGYAFDLIVCGEHYSKAPKAFDRAKTSLEKHLVHWGYFNDRQAYYKALWSATILPVTNNQEFFGLSVMEAVYAGVVPVLPRRLSYPELYQDEGVFYDSDDELIERLRVLLSESYRAQNQLVISEMSWRNVIEKYQNRLSKYAV